MDRLSRRDLLKTRPDPAARQDYLVTFEGRVAGVMGATVELRFVPDRLLLDPVSFQAYLDAVGGFAWGSLESLGAAMQDDLRNELVPRWLLLSVEGQGHRVLFEDRQPKWDNPRLLARLRLY
jgi:7-cyano-7-deazaguanine reductase